MITKVAGAIVAVLILFVALDSFVIVESGHVGVRRTLGAVQPNALPEGLSAKFPLIDRVEEIDMRLQKADSAASAASKDLQVVSTRVAVQYSLIGEIAPKTFQKIGNSRVVAANVIAPAIQESVKAITAQYTAEQLVTKRSEVKAKIQSAIKEFIDYTLSQKGASGALNLDNVAITDFDFSPEFNRAIEEKVQAEQEALKAQNEKLRRVTQAEAAAEERKLAADAEAYQIEAASVAKAEAIEREAKALRDNPDLIQLRLAEKWDGKLPVFTGGDGVVPLIDINQLKKE